MAKIRALLYKTPKFKWKYRYNWLISIWTRSWYSHTEIWTPDDYGEFRGVVVGGMTTRTDAIGNTITSYAHKDISVGTCWTSTTRGNANGTVKRDASEVLKHPENWDYVEIEVDLENYNYDYFMGYMEKEVKANKGYSRWDLLKFISPIHFPDKKRNICSEFVNNALAEASVFEKRGIISPKKLAKKLQKKGYKIQSLVNGE